MRRDLTGGDQVTVTLAGETHTYTGDQFRVSVDDTATRGGDKARYATLLIPLRAGEFPERTGHITGGDH